MIDREDIARLVESMPLSVHEDTSDRDAELMHAGASQVKAAVLELLQADSVPSLSISATNQATDSTVSELSIMLLLYSEWLDVSGLLKTPRQSRDNRTHAELVAAFLKRGAAERLAHQ